MESLLHAAEEDGWRNMAVAATPIELSEPYMNKRWVKLQCSVGLNYGRESNLKLCN